MMSSKFFHQTNLFQLERKKSFYPVILLFTCVLYFFYSFQKYDIIPSDDYVYINTGYYLKLPLTQNYLGFFYPLFFKILFFISGFKEVFSTIYWTYYLLSIGSFLCLYFYLKSLGAKRPISIFIASSFLFSDYQIFLFPKISFFCFILILFTLTLIQKKDLFTKFVWITVLCWVLGYTRPEFFVSFILAFSVVIVLFIAEKRYQKFPNYFGILFPSILVVLGILFLGGQPLGNRGVDAFKQHFVLNYLAWHPEVHLENRNRSEFALFQKVFGEVNTMTDILKQNPPLFFKHIYFNIINYWKLSASLLYHFCFDPLLKVFSYKIKYFFMASPLLLLFLIDIKATLLILKASIIRYVKINGLITLVILLPSFVSVVLIYPREHYFLFHLVVALSVIAIALDSLVFKKNWVIPFLKISMLALFIFGFAMTDIRLKKHTNYDEMYQYLIRLSQKQQLSLTTNEVFSPIFFKEYLGKYDIKSFNNTPQQNIDDVIKAQKVDVIYLEMKSIDPSNQILTSFISKDYQNYGFRKISAYEKLNYLIFVKKGIE